MISYDVPCGTVFYEQVQKEIGELFEAEGDSKQAIDAYQTAADYYQACRACSSQTQPANHPHGSLHVMS